MGLSWVKTEAHYDKTTTNSSGSLSGTTSGTTSGTSAIYGTRTPLLSDDWKAAFAGLKGGLNSSGYTADQQRAVEYARNAMGPNGATGAATRTANTNLQGSLDSLGSVIGGYNWLAGQSVGRLGAAPTEAYVGDVNARTGGSYADAYRNPYERDVISAATADAYRAQDRGLTAMRQGRDAAGAFGDRSSVGDAVYRADSDQNLNSTLSGLRYQGYQSAQDLGQQDANRFLLADTTNQGVRQGINTRATALLDSRERANIGYKDADLSRRERGLTGIQAAELAKKGINQQMLDNVITQDGIDTEKVNALFTAGSISFEQLQALLAAAAAANGESFDQTGATTSTSNETLNRNTTGHQSVTNFGGSISGEFGA